LNKSKIKKKICQIQEFDPDKETRKRIPAEKSRTMAEDTIEVCQESMAKKLDEWKSGVISGWEFLVEVKRLIKTIEKAQTTITEAQLKEAEKHE
jgi:hypothetical protein